MVIAESVPTSEMPADVRKEDFVRWGGDRRWFPNTVDLLLLEKYGVRHEYRRDVAIEQIDVDASRRNNARLSKALLPQTIEEYADRMRSGWPYPALVATVRRDGRLKILGGNQRHAAAGQAGLPTVDVIVCWPEDARVEYALMRELNSSNGERESREQRMLLAQDLVEQRGFSYEEAAQVCNIPEATIRKDLAHLENQSKIEAAGAKTDGLTRSAVQRIAQLQSRPTVRKVVGLVREAKLTDADMGLLVAAVKQAPNEPAAAQVIESYRERPQVRARIAKQRGEKPPVAARPPSNARFRTSLIGALASAQALIDRHPSRVALALTDNAAYDAVVQSARKIYRDLERMRDA